MLVATVSVCFYYVSIANVMYKFVRYIMVVRFCCRLLYIRSNCSMHSLLQKWEKKWTVFAISQRNGPVLDFFDDRANMEKGPDAGTRIMLSATKQVSAAINCKIPYSFIIVTEDRILSLAALSQLVQLPQIFTSLIVCFLMA